MSTLEKQRIGIFGGTFDPIHIGHLILAEEAWYQLNLDSVYLVPAGDPPHKQERKLTPVALRLAMCELATAGNDHIQISRVDADRTGPHYTVDTVKLLQKQWGPEVSLFLLMGMDSLRDLPTWRQPQWLIENCKLVALSRHDVTLDWNKLEAALPGASERIIILDMPEIEIASHIIQRRVRNGQPIRYQVPDAILDFIHAHHLYQNGKEP